jgi:hypothetical protein
LIQLVQIAHRTPKTVISRGSAGCVTPDYFLDSPFELVTILNSAAIRPPRSLEERLLWPPDLTSGRSSVPSLTTQMAGVAVRVYIAALGDEDGGEVALILCSLLLV